MKFSDESLENWRIAETDFPQAGSAADKLRFLLNYAVLAPSSHNSQPWRFDAREDVVELWADRDRALPVVDPAGREMIISCGAALFNMRVALRHFGCEGDVKVLPMPENPDLLACVRPGTAHEPTGEDKALFHAIPERHTNRLPFTEHSLPEALLDELREAAQQEGAWLHLATDDERDALADLIWEAEQLQWAEKDFRRELAEWIRPNRSTRRDGVPGYAMGVGNLKSVAGSLLARVCNLGRGLSERDRARALGAPALVVLGTEDDMTSDWLRAGQALQRVLLRAAADGVSASFFNQPLEIVELRPQVRAAVVETGFPQLLLRLGYGQEVKPTPRRAVAEVCRPAERREGR